MTKETRERGEAEGPRGGPGRRFRKRSGKPQSGVVVDSSIRPRGQKPGIGWRGKQVSPDGG